MPKQNDTVIYWDRSSGENPVQTFVAGLRLDLRKKQKNNMYHFWQYGSPAAA